jgi:hypothetical protein
MAMMMTTAIAKASDAAMQEQTRLQAVNHDSLGRYLLHETSGKELPTKGHSPI